MEIETSFAKTNKPSASIDAAANNSKADSEEIFKRHRICNSKFTHFHLTVFILTYLCQTAVHINRKTLSTAKPVISEEWTPSSINDKAERPKLPDELWNDHDFFPDSDGALCKNFLGGLDTAFMMSYAIGLFFGGQIADRYDQRLILTIGMIGNSVTIFLFSCVGEWLQFYSYYWYIPLWIINGLFQATVGPCILSVMGNWFGKSNRGFIFGIWSTNSSIGNILGSILVASLLDLGYELAMFLPTVIAIATGIFVCVGLVTSPGELGMTFQITDDETDETENQENDKETSKLLAKKQKNQADVFNYNSAKLDASESSSAKKVGAINFFEAILLPGVIINSVAFSGVKLVHYSFFYWLPLYLNRQFHWSPTAAGNLSSWYDVGGIFGAIICGYLSDKLRRSPVLAVMLFISIPLLFVYTILPDNMALNSFMLVVIGFFFGGVANIMSTAVIADLGKQPRLQSDAAALATIAGIMDGAGSAAAAFGQLLIPVIENGLGWNSVFYFLVICCGVTLICFLPIVYREIKETIIWRHLQREKGE